MNWKQQGGRNIRNRQWDNGRHSPAFVNIILTRRDGERGVQLIIVLYFHCLTFRIQQGNKNLGVFAAAMKYLGLLSMTTWLFLRTFAAPLSAQVTTIFKSLLFIWLLWLFIEGCAFLLPWLFLLLENEILRAESHFMAAALVSLKKKVYVFFYLNKIRGLTKAWNEGLVSLLVDLILFSGGQKLVHNQPTFLRSTVSSSLFSQDKQVLLKCMVLFFDQNLWQN